MKKHMTAVIIAFLGFMVMFSPAAEAERIPFAENGVFPVTNFDISSDGVLSLNGDWAFFREQLLEPDDFRTGIRTPPLYIPVPEIWGRTDSGLPNHGYGTYRLLVQLRPGDAGTPLALYMPSVATAYRIWIDGKEYPGNGRVGTDVNTMVPGNKSKVLYFVPERTPVEIVIQVSNFSQRKGGLWEEIRFGNAEAIAGLREQNVLVELFMIGSLFMLGLYHFGLFIFRKGDRSVLYLSLICLLIAMRTSLLGDTLMIDFIPAFPWELAVKIEYWAVFAAGTFILEYMGVLYPAETSEPVRRVIRWTSVASCLLILFLPARLFTLGLYGMEAFIIIVFLHMSYVILKAVNRRRQGSLLNLISIVLILSAVANDIFYYNYLIGSSGYSPMAIFLYLFIQTLIVAMKFSKSYTDFEQISFQLKRLNQDLESTVKERTEELKISRDRLQAAVDDLKRSEASRRQLVSEISHELGTPMTTVQGYIKAMLDGVIDSGDARYMKLIHDKVLYVNRLVQDLFELSKLESNQVRYEMVEVPVHELFSVHFRKFEMDAAAREIKFILRTPPEWHEGESCRVRVDPYRLQQVMTNLIYNAMKYMEPGGTLTLEGEVIKNGSPVLVVSVSDTGSGIPEDQLPNIFNRFFRGDDRNGKSGSGLGLAIAKQIIQHHGGNLHAESRLGEGSTFRFTLPART